MASSVSNMVSGLRMRAAPVESAGVGGRSSSGIASLVGRVRFGGRSFEGAVLGGSGGLIALSSRRTTSTSMERKSFVCKVVASQSPSSEDGAKPKQGVNLLLKLV